MTGLVCFCIMMIPLPSRLLCNDNHYSCAFRSLLGYRSGQLFCFEWLYCLCVGTDVDTLHVLVGSYIYELMPGGFLRHNTWCTVTPLIWHNLIKCWINKIPRQHLGILPSKHTIPAALFAWYAAQKCTAFCFSFYSVRVSHWANSVLCSPLGVYTVALY